MTYTAYAGRGKLALKVGYPKFKVTATVVNNYTGTKNKGKVLTNVTDAFGNVLVSDHVIAYGNEALNNTNNGTVVTLWVTAYRYDGVKTGLKVVTLED